jgi:hypothetical protein
MYGTSIDELMDYCSKENHTLYFHNLKFDGEFIISWLFENGFKHVKDKRDYEDKTFSTLISDKGQFYTMTIVFKHKARNSKKVTIMDSLKILPFSVEKIAEGFNLPISKLEIDYRKERPIGYKLTPEDIEYLQHDVSIVAMALDVLFNQDLTKMTQGSNALYDYKNTIGEKKFKVHFPPPAYDADIRQAYKGGFTYLNPLFKEVDMGPGIVLDVNSLYPSVMYYRPLPYGEGIWFEGQYQEDKLYKLYVQMVQCDFELKPGHIPTLQIKNTLSFMDNEYLTSSSNEYPVICMTNVDLELFLKHYDVFNLEYLSGWKFKQAEGLFRTYIDKWMGIKIQSKLDGNDAMYTLAKLMLNALYGKFALNPQVRSKYPYYDNGIVKYSLGETETREPIYIPVGAFITSWARYTTITAAQSVYDSFIYADTDSLHLKGLEIPHQLEISDTKLGAWKHEGTFRKSRYLRQKTYVEDLEITQKEFDKLTKKKVPGLYVEGDKYYQFKITCAGMPKECYQYVTWDNFHIGSKFDGKLKPYHVKGGIVLVDEEFTIRL